MNKKKHSFLNSVSATISKNKLIVAGDSILIGVSGGADSIALLNIMIELKEEIPLTIGIAHLNHNLRGDESRRDSNFVKFSAEKLNINFHTETLDVKQYQQEKRLSLEDAARQVRYRFLHETAKTKGYNKIATGHNANDNAELVLMNLLRGAGNTGLSGIPVIRGEIIRPLIEMTRKDIIEYLKIKKTDYVNDSSNANRDFLRNKIRLDLLPLLEGNYNKNIIQGLNRTSRIIKDDEDWIENVITPLYKDILVDENEKSISLSIKLLEKLPVAAKRRIIRKTIKNIKGDLKKITLFHTDMLIELLNNPKPFLSVDLPDQIQVHKKDKLIMLVKQNENLRKLKPEKITFVYPIKKLEETRTTIIISEISKKIIFSIYNNDKNIDFTNEKSEVAWIDYNSLKFPITIRNIQAKDSFIPFGMKGSQTLKKFFSSKHISSAEKKKCPLLISNNDIVWIGGHRLHDNYKIHKKTKKLLKVELSLD